jgi:MFS family permease
VTTLFNGGSSAGPAIGAVAVAALVSSFGWRIAFVVLGAIGFVWLAVWQVWYGQPEQVAWLAVAEKDKIVAERNGDSDVTIEDARPSSLRYLLSQKSVWGLVITQGCLVYTAYLFLTWLPTYLQSTRELTTMNTGYLTALPYLATILLSVMIARISDRTLSSAAIQAGKRRNFIVCMALLSMMILFAPVVRELWLLLVILVFVLTGSTTGAGLNFALANDLLRNPRDISRVFAITSFGGNSFGLIAPIITGYIVAGSGRYTWAFRIAAALLFCGAIATLLMTRKTIEPQYRSVTA